jgi:branched-chain amino acid transport system ATP-binding protein
MSAYESVVATIKQEHRVVGHVVEVLQHSLRDVAAEHAEPDFNLLASILYYIDDFPERLHHPKEDDHLFKTLRAQSSEFDAVLDDLQREHVRGAQMVREMHVGLVHYLAAASGSLEAFRSCVDDYASMLRAHMRKEEDLLARAGGSVPEPAWQGILTAFAANEDPLLAEEVRIEFRNLYRRIQNLLPRKLRYPRGSY